MASEASGGFCRLGVQQDGAGGWRHARVEL